MARLWSVALLVVIVKMASPWHAQRVVSARRANKCLNKMRAKIVTKVPFKMCQAKHIVHEDVPEVRSATFEELRPKKKRASSVHRDTDAHLAR